MSCGEREGGGGDEWITERIGGLDKQKYFHHINLHFIMEYKIENTAFELSRGLLFIISRSNVLHFNNPCEV